MYRRKIEEMEEDMPETPEEMDLDIDLPVQKITNVKQSRGLANFPPTINSFCWIYERVLPNMGDFVLIAVLLITTAPN